MYTLLYKTQDEMRRRLRTTPPGPPGMKCGIIDDMSLVVDFGMDPVEIKGNGARQAMEAYIQKMENSYAIPKGGGRENNGYILALEAEKAGLANVRETMNSLLDLKEKTIDTETNGLKEIPQKVGDFRQKLVDWAKKGKPGRYQQPSILVYSDPNIPDGGRAVMKWLGDGHSTYTTLVKPTSQPRAYADETLNNVQVQTPDDYEFDGLLSMGFVSRRFVRKLSGIATGAALNETVTDKEKEKLFASQLLDLTVCAVLFACLLVRLTLQGDVHAMSAHLFRSDSEKSDYPGVFPAAVMRATKNREIYFLLEQRFFLYASLFCKSSTLFRNSFLVESFKTYAEKIISGDNIKKFKSCPLDRIEKHRTPLLTDGVSPVLYTREVHLRDALEVFRLPISTLDVINGTPPTDLEDVEAIRSAMIQRNRAARGGGGRGRGLGNMPSVGLIASSRPVFWLMQYYIFHPIEFWDETKPINGLFSYRIQQYFSAFQSSHDVVIKVGAYGNMSEASYFADVKYWGTLHTIYPPRAVLETLYPKTIGRWKGETGVSANNPVHAFASCLSAPRIDSVIARTSRFKYYSSADENGKGKSRRSGITSYSSDTHLIQIDETIYQKYKPRDAKEWITSLFQTKALDWAFIQSIWKLGKYTASFIHSLALDRRFKETPENTPHAAAAAASAVQRNEIPYKPSTTDGKTIKRASTKDIILFLVSNVVFRSSSVIRVIPDQINLVNTHETFKNYVSLNLPPSIASEINTLITNEIWLYVYNNIAVSEILPTLLLHAWPCINFLCCSIPLILELPALAPLITTTDIQKLNGDIMRAIQFAEFECATLDIGSGPPGFELGGGFWAFNSAVAAILEIPDSIYDSSTLSTRKISGTDIVAHSVLSFSCPSMQYREGRYEYIPMPSMVVCFDIDFKGAIERKKAEADIKILGLPAGSSSAAIHPIRRVNHIKKESFVQFPVQAREALIGIYMKDLAPNGFKPIEGRPDITDDLNVIRSRIKWLGLSSDTHNQYTIHTDNSNEKFFWDLSTVHVVSIKISTEKTCWFVREVNETQSTEKKIIKK